MAEDGPRFSHRVTVVATLDLDEQQLGALDALAGYGDEAFLNVFYAQLGRAYLQPYEKGLRSLFATIRTTVPKALSDVRLARKTLYETEQAQRQKLLAPPESADG